MTIKPNLNPAAQPWARDIESRISGVNRAVIQGAVPNNNSAVQAIAATQQRITTVEGATVAAQESAYAAMESANGKNTVFHTVDGDPDPTTAVEGDILFVHNGTIAGTVNRLAVYTSGAWSDSPVTNEVIANLDAGKITTGSLNAGLIKVTTDPSGTGQRVEIAATGLNAYNASNQVVTSIDSATGALVSGDATIVGTFRNALVGQNRLEIAAFPSGNFTQVRFISSGNFSGGRLVFSMNSVALEGTSQHNASFGSVSISGNPSATSVNGGLVDVMGGYAVGSSRVTLRSNNSPDSARLDLVQGNLTIMGSIDFTNAATKQSARNSLGLSDSGETDISFASGYTHVDTSGNRCQASKVGRDVVMSGLVKPTSGNLTATGWVQIGTVPSGMAPARNVQGGTVMSDSAGATRMAGVLINTSGQIFVNNIGVAAQYISIAVAFRAA